MALTGDVFNTTTFANAFHQVFVKTAGVDLYNFNRPLLKRIPVTEGFVGTNEERVRATSFMGGYGYGSIPRSNESNLIRPRLEGEKFYVHARLDAEAMAQSLLNKGSFFELVSRVKLEIKRAMENGLALALLKTDINKDVILGTVSGAATGTAAAPVITIQDGTWNENSFHIKQIVHFEEDGDNDPFEVTAIDKANKQVTLSRLSGDYDATASAAAGEKVILQGSNGEGFMGLPGACAASGTLYNVSIGTGWEATRDTGTGPITEHRIYNMMMDIISKVGVAPNLVVCSKVQYQKLAEQLANKRVLNDLSDAMGHAELAIMGPEGLVPVIWDPLIEDDTLYVLNTKHMELRKRPMEGLIEAPGGGILHFEGINGNDQYLILYRCFGNFYIEPSYQGIMNALST